MQFIRLIEVAFSLILIFPEIVTADKEYVGHGAASSKFKAEHERDGQHNIDKDHQAILGSKKSAASFDDLSPDESKLRLAAIGRRMDVNNDGFVEFKELTDWILNSMKSVDQEVTDERFVDIDENKDDFISWQEYLTDAFGDFNDSDEMDADDKRLLEEDKLYFAAADLDGDGRLSVEEFVAFQNPEHHPHMHGTLIEATLKEKDADRDGKIDLKEFLGDISENSKSEWYTVEKNRFEEEYDVDHNGFLEGEEIYKWLIPDLLATARQEAEHLISEADVNKDGKLSIDEILAAHSIFVGSEATNYGEKLVEVTHEEL